LKDVLLGGERVEYQPSTRTLLLAGEEFTLTEWLEIRRRIDLIVKRAMTDEDWQEYREQRNFMDKTSRLPQDMREAPPPWEGKGSSFLSKNIMDLTSRKRGRIKGAPWWLRWLFDAVVTKEELA
jgi:hypothetical protein